MPHVMPTPQDVSAIKAILAKNIESELPTSSIGVSTTNEHQPDTVTTTPDHNYVTEYTPVHPELETRYVTHARYPEEVFQTMQLPQIFDVPTTTIGANTVGMYFPSSRTIWMNNAPWYQGLTYGKGIIHERDQHDKGIGTVPASEEEPRARVGMVIMDNYATDQLAFGAWHP